MAGTELVITEIETGTGKETQRGALLIVQYEGFLEDGIKFDSSHDRGKPFQFVFGTGRVIKGWDLGLINMREGGIRKLFVPAHLAYGDKQIGKMIKPQSNLVFHVELLEVRVREK